MTDQSHYQPSNSPELSLPQQYQNFIEQAITATLQGKILSKEQLYQMVVKEIQSGTGEIFERCLNERVRIAQEQLEHQTSEAKKAKISRQIRALDTIGGVWERWQKEKQDINIYSQASEDILQASPQDRFSILLQKLDLNQTNSLNRNQIKQLADSLTKTADSLNSSEEANQLHLFSRGLLKGLESFRNLENDLVSWIYQGGNKSVGFEGIPGSNSPWTIWAKRLDSPLPRHLFELQALNQPVTELAKTQNYQDISAWIELVIILRSLQQGLVNWFDQQPYSATWGKRLSNATLLTFAVIWCELSNGLQQATNLNSLTRQLLAKGCFQITLQILRTFAQRPDFPLYGGVFVSFWGDSLRDTLNYLSEPLRQIEGTQEKGRILTILGYSQRTLGRYEQANTFHQEALRIAQDAGDNLCQIANFNHLSRNSIAQKEYAIAINYSQRALILARQTGDRLGEANALANLGYSQVLAAQATEEISLEVYQQNISYLEQGLQLSERLEDHQSLALCYNSLGIAYLVINQPTVAYDYLEKAVKAAQLVRDLYLQGISFTYLAEAYYNLNQVERAVYNGCLGMYLLERIGTKEWRGAAGLLTVIQGRVGQEKFQSLIVQYRPKLIEIIGVEGVDHLPQLLKQYQE
ncbi:TPR repeat-containing protein [Gloeothece citriformis PCC 7424]|uniref:TPR repeat-containing protein n=1 Tax=Gloeothece citriformis (strain PCC 7424) TaxID=65393 RepID=B7KG35_GLOC7|nr:tetratricopeptide repeat protein [Gloeothece citriformis]ACK69228.1 TPR repeat-containing protein [Gloeothece citriformis PCC 7424]